MDNHGNFIHISNGDINWHSGGVREVGKYVTDEVIKGKGKKGKGDGKGAGGRGLHPGGRGAGCAGAPGARQQLSRHYTMPAMPAGPAYHSRAPDEPQWSRDFAMYAAASADDAPPAPLTRRAQSFAPGNGKEILV